MTANEIRRSYLKYFERNGHRIVASAPLVPHDDPTLLFTNAGMNQFKDVFLGQETRDYTRATTAQKVMRVSGKHNDLNAVGPSHRHHTFFEMLGNFSFGDYFKQEAIPLAWTLLTEEWQLPKEKLFATVFNGEGGVPRDDEAYEIWRRFLPAEQISELGAADNFWQMGDTGPCGRCSEIYFYRGTAAPCGEEAGGGACRGLECSCDRYTEIWNNVFMEFNRQADGRLNPLPARSIDTGMGLERVTAVIQGVLSNYDTDLFTPLLEAIGERLPPPAFAPGASAPREGGSHGDGGSHRRHGGTMEPGDVSMRVIADHMRAMTFLIADGVVPSNEARGYVLRKIMRRAMRHGKRLGLAEPFLFTLVDVLVREFGDAYPELRTSRDTVAQIIRSEEERFGAVLTEGLPRLEDALDRAVAGDRVLSGDVAFRLYDTHGLPLDFIEDMADDRQLTFDRAGFNRAMEGQREKARAKSKFKTAIEAKPWRLPPATADDLKNADDAFRGYEGTEARARIAALFRESQDAYDFVLDLKAGDEGFAILSETPFYLEAGGQVSDVGTIAAPHGEATVQSVLRTHQFGPRLHGITVTQGSLGTGDTVSARVTRELRDATRRNHTATHLLHAALRAVLGPHVKQAGSLVAPDRLRFDFVHFSAITPGQLLEIEQIVNEQVLRNSAVITEVKATAEAIAGGAMALFGEKYGDKVRVVSVPGFSTELCGGTHVSATGDIGLFAVDSESGVAAGVRRIEAVTGLGALRRYQAYRQQARMLAQQLNAREDALADALARVQDEGRRLTRDLQQARMQAALGGGSGAGLPEALDIAGVKLVAREVAGLDKDGLRALVDRHRDQIKSGVVVIASPSDGKVSIVVGVTSDLITRAPAGQIVKQLAPIVGGGGGGRPDFAEAGGKDPSKVAEMLAAAPGVIEKLLSA